MKDKKIVVHKYVRRFPNQIGIVIDHFSDPGYKILIMVSNLIYKLHNPEPCGFVVENDIIARVDEVECRRDTSFVELHELTDHEIALIADIIFNVETYNCLIDYVIEGKGCINAGKKL